MSTKAQSSPDSTYWATSGFTHMPGKLMLVIGIPGHLDLSISPSKCPEDTDAGFPQGKKSARAQGRGHHDFLSLTLRSLTPPFLYYATGDTDWLYSMWEETMRWLKSQEAGIKWSHRGG